MTAFTQSVVEEVALERVRDEIAARMPLFGFYRALLRWLFVDPSAEPPIHEGVEVVLTE